MFKKKIVNKNDIDEFRRLPKRKKGKAKKKQLGKKRLTIGT